MVSSCIVDGCARKYKARGLCVFHYHRWRRNGDYLAGGPPRLHRGALGECHVDGCGKNAVARHLCPAHYAKLKKFGDPTAGYSQDGRSKVWHPNKDGYLFRFDPTSPHAGGNKLVYQHREVMGDLLGRPLLRGETVHHKNGDRADNRIENLELWVRGQPAGQRVQDLVAWARDVLRRYGDVADIIFEPKH